LALGGRLSGFIVPVGGRHVDRFNDFLIALRMLAEHGVMIKKLSDVKERHKTTETESIAALLTRGSERGDEEAISLLAAGALERCV
jgi:hypothetical protein